MITKQELLENVDMYYNEAKEAYNKEKEETISNTDKVNLEMEKRAKEPYPRFRSQFPHEISDLKEKEEIKSAPARPRNCAGSCRSVSRRRTFAILMCFVKEFKSRAF
jgi:hypothetical protein